MSKAFIIKKDEDFVMETGDFREANLYLFFTGEFFQTSGAGEWLSVASGAQGATFASGNAYMLMRRGNQVCLEFQYNDEGEDIKTCMTAVEWSTLLLQMERAWVEMPERIDICWHENGSATFEWDSTCTRSALWCRDNSNRYSIRQSDYQEDFIMLDLLNSVIDLLQERVDHSKINWIFWPMEGVLILGNLELTAYPQERTDPYILIRDCRLEMPPIRFTRRLISLIYHHVERILDENPQTLCLKWYERGAAFEWDLDEELVRQRTSNPLGTAVFVREDESYSLQVFTAKDSELLSFFTDEPIAYYGVSKWLVVASGIDEETVVRGDAFILMRQGDLVCLEAERDKEAEEGRKICMSAVDACKLLLQVEQAWIEMPDKIDITWYENGSATLDWLSTSSRSALLHREGSNCYKLDQNDYPEDNIIQDFLNSLLSLLQERMDTHNIDWMSNPSEGAIQLGNLELTAQLEDAEVSHILIRDCSDEMPPLIVTIQLFSLLYEHGQRIFEEPPPWLRLNWYERGAAFEWCLNEAAVRQRTKGAKQ